MLTSKITRNLIGNIFIHNITQGKTKKNIFKTKKDKQKYLNLIQKYHLKYNINIISYCIIESHAQLLLYANDIKNINLFLKNINSEYSAYYNKNNNKSDYIFKTKSTNKLLIEKQDILKHIKYIHMIPVKEKKVKNETEYYFSSYNDYKEKSKFIDQNLFNSIFDSNTNYLEKLNSMQYKDLKLESIEKIKIEEVLKEYCNIENINLNNIKENKTSIQKFMCYLISNDYKFTKKEIAKSLGLSNSVFYKMFGKYEKSGK